MGVAGIAPSAEMRDGRPDDEALYRRYAPELYRYATMLVGRDDAPDVVTDAVVAAFASPAWASVANHRAYLYRAVLNTASSHQRRAASRRTRERRVASGVIHGDPPSSLDAERALVGLSPQQRAIVYLAYWDDLTAPQIADLLGVGEGTVRKQLARARQRLRSVLDG